MVETLGYCNGKLRPEELHLRRRRGRKPGLKKVGEVVIKDSGPFVEREEYYLGFEPELGNATLHPDGLKGRETLVHTSRVKAIGTFRVRQPRSARRA